MFWIKLIAQRIEFNAQIDITEDNTVYIWRSVIESVIVRRPTKRGSDVLYIRTSSGMLFTVVGNGSSFISTLALYDLGVRNNVDHFSCVDMNSCLNAPY